MPSSQSQKSSLTEEGWDNDSGEGDIQTCKWYSDFMAFFLTMTGLQDLVPIPETPITDMGLEMEEIDEEDREQTEESGLETPENADSQEATAGLVGERVSFGRKYTGRTTPISPQKLKKLLAKKDLYDIPRQYRGTVYRHWEDQINQKMLRELKVHAQAYAAIVNRRKVAKDSANISLIQALNTRVIGATTTGLGKYRGLLSALEPRILVIEEAAETLEGAIIAGMFDSLQQLILVGDHNQLQAQCSGMS
jgi:helicase required for RNAi-mediated heterochromatin assembly 1